MQQFAAKKIQSDVKNDVVILGRGKILLSKVIVFHSTVMLYFMYLFTFSLPTLIKT